MRASARTHIKEALNGKAVPDGAVTDEQYRKEGIENLQLTERNLRRYVLIQHMSMRLPDHELKKGSVVQLSPSLVEDPPRHDQESKRITGIDYA